MCNGLERVNKSTDYKHQNKSKLHKTRPLMEVICGLNESITADLFTIFSMRRQFGMNLEEHYGFKTLTLCICVIGIACNPPVDEIL